MQNRTHTCNELRMAHVGQTVQISGWMENVREVSANLAFVVVRDFYGTTQVEKAMAYSVSSTRWSHSQHLPVEAILKRSCGE